MSQTFINCECGVAKTGGIYSRWCPESDENKTPVTGREGIHTWLPMYPRWREPGEWYTDCCDCGFRALTKNGKWLPYPRCPGRKP